MYPKYTIDHLLPGRIRLTIPKLSHMHNEALIKEMFEAIKGVKNIRMIPIIQSIVIEYDPDILNYQQILRYVHLFFYQMDERSPILMKKDMRNSLIRSGISGTLLLAALLSKKRSTMLDYMVVISTSYTVLSHGENKLSHPDVITGIISMMSLGSQNIIQASMASWIINLLEIFNDWKRNPNFQYY